MTDHRPRRLIAPVAAVAIAAGLAAGFALGRLTAPSDLATLEGRIFTGGPSQSARPEGADNDGELLLSVDVDGTLTEEGLRLVEQTGEIRLGVGNAAAEAVSLYVERETTGGSGEWEVIFSREIEAKGTLVGTLLIAETGSYRVAVALASSPDTFSVAPLSVWQPE